MEEEADDDKEDEELNSGPSKKRRREHMVLDEEEEEIASGLRPSHETSRDASQLEKDKTISEDVDSAGAESEGNVEVNGAVGGAVDDFSGDGGTGFENNGACSYPFLMILCSLLLHFRWNFISLKIEHPLLHSPKDLDLDQLRLGCQMIPSILTAPK
jgi:hypothetical protein